MADSTGKDPKAGETGSGAVKPPVLDLKARPSAPASAAESKPSSAPASGTAVPPKPGVPPTGKPDDKPAATPSSSSTKPAAAAPSSKAGGSAGGLVGAAIIGGLLGLGGAYGLAVTGNWPTQPLPPAAVDPQVATLAKAIPELETVTQTTQSELARANQRLAALESAAPPAATEAVAAPDTAAIEASIAGLTERLDALSAAPQGTTDSAALDGLRSELASLTTRLDEVAARVGTGEASLKTLESTVATTSAALAQQPSDIGAVLQLPLILSGLETAFASGRPYETELAALRAGLPEASVPTVIANAAASGLPRPDTIARQFADVVPAMLAGRPVDPNAGWQAGALDWFAGIIALQPNGEIEGDSPDAVLSRAKAAVDRRDFTAAQALIASLPASMRDAAGAVPGLIADQAAAQEFLLTLRSQALAGEVTP